MKPILMLLRPWQWVKNLFVFLPAFFGGKLWIANGGVWLEAAVVFVSFCMSASAVYCLNDIVDRRSDAAHPHRRDRPVASGRVSVGTAAVTGVLMATAAVAAAWYGLPVNGGVVAAVVAGYLILNVLYCLWLKHMAVIDVITIAAGYVLRIVAGGLACAVHLSPWIVIMVFLVTLLVAMGKRRSDVVLRNGGGYEGRESTRGYTLPFINSALAVVASATMVSYILYTVSPEVMDRLDSEYIYVTAVFVLAGLLRYLQLVISYGLGDNPVRLIAADRRLQICVCAWIVSFAFIIYS